MITDSQDVGPEIASEREELERRWRVWDPANVLALTILAALAWAMTAVDVTVS